MGRFRQPLSHFDGASHRCRWCWWVGVCAVILLMGDLSVLAQSQPKFAALLKPHSLPSSLTKTPQGSDRPELDGVIPIELESSPLLGFTGELNHAVRNADASRLAQLLESGVSIENWEGTGDDGVVAYCVREGRYELGLVLLSFGVDPNRYGYEGGSPLQMAIAMRDATMVNALLVAGADPNLKFPRPISDAFLSITDKESMQWFLKRERRLSPLMMAANNGDLEVIKALLDHGAERYIRSGRYRLYPLNFASRRSDVKSMQVMLGKDPKKEPFHLVLDLSEQRLRLYDAQHNVVFSSRVSTGKAGYRTPKGEYVITDKHRSHRSTIYNVKMPYFQRLSSGAIGFHSGYVPGYPASHGCIRMPYQSAKELFSTTPAGTRVVIQD